MFGHRKRECGMNLYIAHNSNEKLSCSFYTVVVRNAALAEVYPGGLRGFVSRYRAQSNIHITIFCAMGGEFEDTAKDLIANGLKIDEDFALFDAGRLALSASIDMGPIKRPQMIDIGISWLRVQYTPGGMFVWYAGNRG